MRLLVKWCFPADGRKSGSWRTSKPDTDNLEKALKDEMTRLHFWADDAQVPPEDIDSQMAVVKGITAAAKRGDARAAAVLLKMLGEDSPQEDTAADTLAKARELLGGVDSAID